jgi:hypothetical protein
VIGTVFPTPPGVAEWWVREASTQVRQKGGARFVGVVVRVTSSDVRCGDRVVTSGVGCGGPFWSLERNAVGDRGTVQVLPFRKNKTREKQNHHGKRRSRAPTHRMPRINTLTRLGQTQPGISFCGIQ